MGRTLLLLILIVMIPRVAYACGCYSTGTVLDDYEEADLVIIARMNSVTKGSNHLGSDISHATMAVKKVFKGDVKIDQELTFENGDPVLDCSWQFFADYVGQSYLLYLYRPKKRSEPFVVSSCNRSTGVEAAHEDLLFLENIDRLRGRTRVSGFVKREGADYDKLEGQRVRIARGNKSYIATTDKNGVYELYDLPPGRYTIEPLLETGWMMDGFHLTRDPTRAELMAGDNRPLPKKISFTLRPKRHFGVSMRLRLNNRVAGRVTTPAGQPLNRVCVSLVPLNTNLIVCNAITNADGTFAIRSVNAGSYNLLINHENIRSSYQPFPRLYYPGVADAAAAKLFTVNFAESIEGLNFVVPVDDTVRLEGVVRYANGRPASDRYVGFATPKSAGVDGSINTRTDESGRFSLTVLKGLRGELVSTFPPSEREFARCPQLKKLLQESGKTFLVFETERLEVEANENRTFALKLPVSPCR